MLNFRLWFLLESARLDPAAYNSLFRSQLDELLPKVTEPVRRQSLEKMRSFDFAGYILMAVRNAGFTDAREREEKAHDIITNLLVSPGNLFGAYEPEESGPMEARWKLAVMYEIRALRKRRGREASRASRFTSIGNEFEPGRMPVDQIADPRTRSAENEDDPNLIASFRNFVQHKAGNDVLKVLDKKLDGLSARQLYDLPEFQHLRKWGIEKAMRTIQMLAHEFATVRGNQHLLSFINKVMGEKEARRQHQAEKPADFDQAAFNSEKVYRLIRQAGPQGISRGRLHKNSHMPIEDLEAALSRLTQDGRVRMDLDDGEKTIRAVEPGLVTRSAPFAPARVEANQYHPIFSQLNATR